MRNGEIKAIIFDLGRVLIDVDFKRGLFRYAHKNSGSDEDKLIDKLFSDPLFIHFGTGKIEPPEFYQQILKRLNEQINFDQFEQAWCDIFSPMKGMEQLIADLKNKYPLGLLSDTDTLHWNFVKNNYPILNYFANPVLSFEIGTLKPNSHCYEMAAQSVQVDPENCLFIDDRAKNVKGARQNGMKAIQFSGIENLIQEFKQLNFI